MARRRRDGLSDERLGELITKAADLQQRYRKQYQRADDIKSDYDEYKEVIDAELKARGVDAFGSGDIRVVRSKRQKPTDYKAALRDSQGPEAIEAAKKKQRRRKIEYLSFEKAGPVKKKRKRRTVRKPKAESGKLGTAASQPPLGVVSAAAN
ncbi:hypothetical protein [Stratiformator vulcanicus]|uniref:Uncharacterized protein n=1 Tax=Stratiformator vulcanicus TaxID=2527980 RepID=A0A517R7D0_9PLAN|nr:hypothetical protein [Stratiformator vulcanicus]QDT39762.1 hypothetical protein Pan189_41710 [Stratiformator vulcanicus]